MVHTHSGWVFKTKPVYKEVENWSILSATKTNEKKKQKWPADHIRDIDNYKLGQNPTNKVCCTDSGRVKFILWCSYSKK